MGIVHPPVGTVTVLLGDVEGSSGLWERDGDAMAEVIRRIDDLVAKRLAGLHAHRPREQGEGDNLVIVFSSANDAVRVAHDLAVTIDDADWPGDLRIRMRFGLHTGDVVYDEDTGYLGTTFNRCARIREFGHGGQVLLSEVTRSLADAPLLDGATIVDHGVHELRGLGREERVLELVRAGGSARPLRSATVVPNNVPATVSSLVGRTEEIERLRTWLTDHRLVTLSGPGGAGKTRLATETAHSLVADSTIDLTGGMWFIDLPPVSEDGRLASTIAEVLDETEVGGRRAPQMLAALVGAKPMAFVLDNCEHLIDEVAELADLLLASCANLRVIATSREALGIEGEAVVRVKPLELAPQALATLAELAEHDATRLFLERANVVAGVPLTDDDAPSIAAVCEQLDGIPLAIELAAARTKFLSPSDIAQGLQDRFRLLGSGSRRANARQRTLEASVAWSHDLLDDEERAVFRRLAVFPRAFHLDAARHVGSLGSAGASAVAVLEGLVDKSLVVVGTSPLGTTYRLLETIRHYAADRLAEAGEVDAAMGALLDHLLASTRIGRPDPLIGLDEAGAHRYWAQQDDIRAVMAWAPGAGRRADLVRLLQWTYMGHSNFGGVREVVATLQEALDSGRLDEHGRARALAVHAAHLASASIRHPAEEYAIEAVELAQRVDDEDVALMARIALSLLTWWTGAPQRYVEDLLASTTHGGIGYFAGGALGFTRSRTEVGRARQLLEQAVRDCRDLGTDHGTGLTLAALAIVNLPADLDRTVAMAEEAAEIGHRLGHRALETVAIFNGAWMAAVYRGRPDQIAEGVSRAYEAAGPPGTGTHAMAQVMEIALRLHTGELERIDELVASARHIADRRDNQMWKAWLDVIDAEVRQLRGDDNAALTHIDEAMSRVSWEAFPFLHGQCLYHRAWAHWRQGRGAEGVDDLFECLTTKNAEGDLMWPYRAGGLALLAAIVSEERPEVAATMLGAVDAALEADAGWLMQIYEIPRAEAVEAARTALGDQAFEVARVAGRELTIDDAIVLV